MTKRITPLQAFLLGAILFAVSSSMPYLFSLFAGDFLDAHKWMNQVIIKSILAILALIGTYLATTGNFSMHGYKRAEAMKWWKAIWPGLLLGAGSAILILATPARGLELGKQFTFLQIILIVVIFSSLSEEMFTRGLIQSILSGYRDRQVSLGVATVSLPVFVSALLFGAMHISIFVKGGDWLTTIIIIIYTFSLGLVAGNLREKHDSLFPAIVVHMSANVGGILMGMIYMIFKVISQGGPR